MTGRQRTNCWHGSEQPTGNIGTAFDVTRPKLFARFLGGQETHGWITAVLLHEMTGLELFEGFENVESKFNFTRCIRQGSVEAPALVQIGKAVLTECGERMEEAADGGKPNETTQKVT